MNKTFIFLIGVLFCTQGFSQEIVYVDQDATGNNDGSGWADAYTDFQTAINSSNSGDTIWVKEGLYIPQGAERTSSFNLKAGVAVLGGFKGNETLSKQRDFINNLTILSGNIGDESLDSDNSYHVLNLTSCSGSLLDGFHIQEGRAVSGNYPEYIGGGIYMYYAGTVIFSNCVIENNTATYGGGVCIDYSSSAKFYNVVFTNNSASSFGSAVHCFYANPLLVNCVITQNPAGSSVLCSYNSSINWQLVNTTISGNMGGNSLDITGGGSLTAINCIIDGAVTGNIECAYTYKSGSAIYGEGNITGETGFYDNTDPVGADGLWFTADDGLQLTLESPARNAGSNSVTGELEKDILGIARKNDIATDMGAYEFDSIPVFSNQTIKASTYLSTGEFVGTIEAFDPDNTELTYEILDGAGIFYNIDKNTGNITINDISSLDNSQEHETEISMRVYDIVSYSDAVVTVKLLPRNAPTIDDGQQFTIDENTLPGTFVGAVNATAGDITPITYLILSGNEEGTFSIDENTGEIYVLDNSTLNYEVNNELILEVGVTDGELVAKSTIHILINNINEVPETQNYRIFVSQLASNSTIVGDVPASDPESAALDYSIQSGDMQEIFSINEDGQIVLEKNHLLDYKSISFYQLEVEVSDGFNVDTYEVIVDIEPPVNTNITYVNEGAYGANDGSSWLNAFTDLQTAINSSSSGDTIWVKEGEYTPQGSSRAASFNLKPGIIVLGGFKADETKTSQRDFANNITILSGNIGDKDLDSDNSYHVLNLASCSGAQLDGFYIQDGRANGSSYDYRGGGIHMYNSGLVTFSNCVIKNNLATYGGGVCVSYNGNPKFINVIFQGNSTNSYGYGGAIQSFHGNTELINCVFTENYGNRGILCSYNSGITWQLTNTTFYGNTGGACLDITGGGSSTVVNSIIVGSVSGTNTCTYTYKNGSALTGEGNITGEINFLDESSPVGVDGFWFTDDDGLQLDEISQGIDAGSAAAVSTIETDIVGGERSRGTNPDLGAYEFNRAPVIDNTTSFSIYVYEATGTLISTFTASDPESDVISYSIESGNINNAFEIGTDNGELRVNNSDALNYGIAPVFDLIIKASDGSFFDTARVVINLKKLEADITLTNSALTYNGFGQGLTAITDPVGLTVEYTYNSSTELPVNAGTYSVQATINDDTYEGNASATLTIEKATQTITFAPINSKTYGDVPFELSANGGGSGNPVVFESSDTDVANVDGNQVTIVGAGTATITSTQEGNGNFLAATPVEQTLNVAEASATLTFENATYTYDGTAQTVPFSMAPDSLAKYVTVEYYIYDVWTQTSPVNSGNYEARASLVHSNYEDETKTATLTIDRASQTITFYPIDNKTYGDVPFEITANGGESGNLVVFESSDTEVATVDGDQVTIVGAGTAIITATQEGNENYLAATPEEQILNVAKATAILTFEDAVYTYDGTNQAVPFAIVPDSLAKYVTVDYYVNEAWSLSAPINSGDYGARASLVHSNYEDETKTATLTIDRASQTITFDPIDNKTYGDVPFEITANGGESGNPVVFESSDTEVATVDGDQVTIVGAGTATITATQAGNENYLAATPMEQTLNVAKASATITFEDATYSYDGTSQTVPFSIVPVSIDAYVTVEYYINEEWTSNSPINSGEYVAQAKLEHPNYEAETKTATLTIDRAPQTITFDPIDNKTYGNIPFELTANGGDSGNPVVFESSDTEVATVVGDQVTIVGAGTATITATQAGNENYLAATPMEQTLNVAKASATITFEDATYSYDGTSQTVPFSIVPVSIDAYVTVEYYINEEWTSNSPINSGEYGARTKLEHPNYEAETKTATLTIDKAPQTIKFGPIDNKTYGDATFGLTANGGDSGNPVVFESSDSEVATVDGDQVTIVGAGTAIITATQEGNENYLAATPVEQTLKVVMANATITFEDAVYTYDGENHIVPSSIAPDSLAKYVTVEYYVNDVWSQNSPINSGDYDARASFAHPNYEAETKTATLTIEKATQTINFESINNKTYGDVPFELTANGGDSGNPIVFESSNTDVATIDGNIVTIVGVGKSTITATKEGNENYEDALQVEQIFVVEKAVPEVLGWPVASEINAGHNLSNSTLSGGEASVQGMFVFIDPDTVLNAGTHVVGVRFEATDQTLFTSVEGTVTIEVLLVNKVETTNTVDVNVYPNPANDFIKIKGLKAENYSIVNINGEIMKQGDFNNSELIDITSLKHGTYFLFINEEYIVKFVKF